MEPKDWTKVFSTTNPHLADIIQGMLEEHQINCTILNKRDSAYGLFGEIEIYALQGDASKAAHLIETANL